MKKLSAVSLTKVYRGRRVVDSVSLEVRPGEVVGLLGPNGAGKTTTFYLLVGMVRSDGGKIFLNEEDITHYPMYLRARKGLTYLPQEPSAFRNLTVAENIMAILEIVEKDRKRREERLWELLSELDIAHIAQSPAYVLSGGERRRVEITRALTTSPYYMLLDEPFAGIDPLAVIDIQKIIDKLKNKGIGILISDHNVRETLTVCDRAYIIHEGSVIEEGSPEKIVHSDMVRKIYLGERFTI